MGESGQRQRSGHLGITLYRCERLVSRSYRFNPLKAGTDIRCIRSWMAERSVRKRAEELMTLLTPESGRPDHRR